MLQPSSPKTKEPLTVSLNRDQHGNTIQTPSLRHEQHLVPQRRSSRKGGAHNVAPVVDNTTDSKSSRNHGRSQKASTPKAKYSTSPLKIRKTRENRVMPPRLVTTTKSVNTNPYKHIADDNQPRTVALEIDPRVSVLPPVDSTDKSFSNVMSLTSSNPNQDFPSKEREKAAQLQQPSTSIDVVSNFLQQTRADPQLKHSIRKRVFARMLGAIQDKGKGMSSTSWVQGGNPSCKRSCNDTETSDSILSWKPDFISTPRESITIDSTEDDNDNWESLISNDTTAALKSYKLPTIFPPSFPQPNLALPTDRIRPLYSKSLREPKAVLSVTVTASPEVESFDLHKAGSIWAAIQIRGDMFIPEGMAAVECDRSIDLAVIVDNSYVGYGLGTKTSTDFLYRKFSSPACLESACSQVMHIARLLQNPADRLAVFATVCCHESDSQESPGCCQLHALGSPKIQKLETWLKALVQPKQNQTLHDQSFYDTLFAAHNTLDSIDQCHDTSIGRSIIVLTPNPIALAEVMHITPFRIHVILPGIAPFSSMPFETFRGWWLNAGMTPMPVDFNQYHGGFNSHLHSIGELIAYERSMSDVGQVTNVFVYLKPGKTVEIEGTVGDLWYPSLLPGQIVSILVKINVKALATPSQSTNSRSSTPSSRNSLEDAFANIELMLGEVLCELLKIEVVYSHSYFPKVTSLTVHESCWLLRTNSMLGQPHPRTEPWNEQRKSFIRGLLAYQLSSVSARSHPDGLTKLENALQQIDFSVCENYLGLLKYELAFQRGIATDDYFITHIERKGPVTDEPSPCFGYFSLENQHTTYCDIAELNNEKRSSGTDSPSTIIHRIVPNGQSGVDAAQKIWRHIRKHSKTRHELDQMMAEPAEDNEEIKEIKQRALKNKRSVGADTLRSIALHINSS